MQFPISIGLRRSFFLSLGIISAHVAAAVTAFIPPWPANAVAALFAAIVGSTVFAWRFRQPAVDFLRLYDDGRIEVRLPREESFREAELQGAATVHPWLTVVPLKIDGRKNVLVLLSDSLRPEDFRRLRVWLRWRAGLSVANNGV